MSFRCFLLVLSLVSAAVNGDADADAMILLPFGTRNTDNPFPVIFNFGDSNSDTGSCSSTFIRTLHPNGITYFGKPSGRLSDGRLIIDFIAEKLKLPHLIGYLDAIQANFKHGVNFAVSGSSITPVDRKIYAQGVIPISLNLQLLQFQHFKDRLQELYNQDDITMVTNRLPKLEDFSKALYTFDIGQNDIGLYININMSRDQAYKFLPDLISQVSLAIEQVYDLGGRSFLIHNTGPFGCLPLFIQRYSYDSDPENFDEIGCVKSYNDLAKEFNRLLKERVYLLRTKLEDSSLVYVDMYSAKYSLIRDAQHYGFIDPLGYCCKDCLNSGSNPYWYKTIVNHTVVHTACDDPSKYITWDGIHYTEAANHWLFNHIFERSDV